MKNFKFAVTDLNRFDDDLTFSAITTALERPTSTVKSPVARAIARLRMLLTSACERRCKNADVAGLPTRMKTSSVGD